MKYINKINGSVIECASKLGGVWEEEKTSSHTKPEKKESTITIEEPKKAKRTKKNE